MSAFPDELRLVYLLLLNAAVLAGAYRFASRRGSGQIGDSLADVGLIYFIVQYVAVGLPGMLGILNVASMGAVSVIASVGLWWAGRRCSTREKSPARSDAPAVSWIGLITAILALSFLASVVYAQKFLPPTSEDVLTYHLPAAAQWLNRGVIGLFPTWFFNPANTYSPLAGSALAAWWMGPMGNDFLARFVQLPALLLIFVLVRQVARELGAGASLALTIAAAAMLCRSFIAEAVEPKDDIFLCACFLCVVAGCAPRRLSEPLGPWRVGAALGLMLATKYTAIYSLFCLVFLLDAPWRAGWRLRHWIIAAAVALLLAGPWYVRNWVMTGNPLYPLEIRVAGHTVLRGLFHTQRSAELGSIGGAWKVLALHYRSPGIGLIIVLAAAWIYSLIASLIGKSPSLMRDPLARACILGPLVGVGLFVFTSPYPEVRFVYPSLLLLFGCCALALNGLCARLGPHRNAATPAKGDATRHREEGGPRQEGRGKELAAALVGAGIAVLAGLTSFTFGLVLGMLPLAGEIAAVALLLAALLRMTLLRAWLTRDRRLLLTAAAALAVAAWIYVDWKATLKFYHRASLPAAWKQWNADGAGWQFARDNIPPDATIAYTNDHLVYPLLGFDHRRRIVYVPTRAGVQRIADLPPFPRPVNARTMIPAFTTELWQNTDERRWLDELRASGTKYLWVARHAKSDPGVPPELTFTAKHAAIFRQVFHAEDEQADNGVTIFQISW